MQLLQGMVCLWFVQQLNAPRLKKEQDKAFQYINITVNEICPAVMEVPEEPDTVVSIEVSYCWLKKRHKILNVFFSYRIFLYQQTTRMTLDQLTKTLCQIQYGTNMFLETDLIKE